VKETRVLLIFTAAYMLAGLAAALAFGITEFVFYLAAAPFLVGCIAFIHIKTDVPLSLLTCLTLLGLLHVLGGLVPVPESWPAEGKHLLYNLWIFEDRLKFDQVVHAYGNGIATWLCWHLMRHTIASIGEWKTLEIEAKPIFLIICLFAGVGIGAFNELGEFMTTLMIEENSVGGYENTGFDLVANTVGSVIAVFLIRFKRVEKLAAGPREI